MSQPITQACCHSTPKPTVKPDCCATAPDAVAVDKPELTANCCHGGGESSQPGVTLSQLLSGPLFWRLLGAVFCAGWGMVLSLAVNDAAQAGDFGWHEPMYPILHGGLILSALGVMGLLGGPLLKATLSALHQRRLSVEALFALSILGAFIGSVLSTLTGVGAVYYEVVAITLAIYTIGKTIGERSRHAAIQAAENLRQSFSQAYRLIDGQRDAVAVSQVAVGSEVSIAPGEPITVDGVVVSGKGFVKETPLTGEPTPVTRQAGDTVMAGTYSVDGTFTVRTTHGLGERKLDAVLETVESARLQPSQLQVQADQLMRWFVPLVVAVSLATLLFWLPQGWAQALFYAMAVLLVACPCALGLATPIAVYSGLHQMSRLGLIVRTGDFIDTLARCQTMVFDKTGTLSLEQVRLTHSEQLTGDERDLPRLLSALRVAQQGNPHPFAQAMREMPLPEGAPGYTLQSAEIVEGQGVVARVVTQCGCEHTVRVGSAELMPASIQGTHAASSSSINGSIVYAVMDENLSACFTFAETLRDDAEHGLKTLQNQGVNCHIFSGDPNPRWPEIGGVPVIGGMTPQNKVERIQKMNTLLDATVFVGDGINDAAAMSQCAGSITMGHGAELARATSTAVLFGNAISQIAVARTLAMQIRRAVRTNLWFAASYNGIGMTLAATGYLNPVLAALLMLISSLIVSIRAIRSTRVANVT